MGNGMDNFMVVFWRWKKKFQGRWFSESLSGRVSNEGFRARGEG